jgi:8-oxo-dGTP pyrophosphatase MutT (NUDIX family)
VNKPQLDHIPEAKPSATVVLLREIDSHIEVLMLQKNSKINYGGSWVFPGGVCDQEDYASADRLLGNREIENVAKITASREAMEEAGLELNPLEMAAFAHWTTPKFRIKRYAAWFLIADARQLNQTVVIDQGEIVQARWLRPAQAIAEQASGSMMLNGPSFVTLSQLASFGSVEDAIGSYQEKSVEFFKPRGYKTDQGMLTLYHGDSEYELDQQPTDKPESAHRLHMLKEGAWRYLNH